MEKLETSKKSPLKKLNNGSKQPLKELAFDNLFKDII